jgi:hypothetical protein
MRELARCRILRAMTSAGLMAVVSCRAVIPRQTATRRPSVQVQMPEELQRQLNGQLAIAFTNWPLVLAVHQVVGTNVAVLCDGAATGRKVSLDVRGVSRKAALASFVDHDEMAWSPGWEVLYVGPKNRAKWARTAADVLRQGMATNSEERSLAPCASDFHVDLLVRLARRIHSAAVHSEVAESDPRGIMQNVMLSYDMWWRDWLWIGIALSETEVQRSGNSIVVVVRRGIEVGSVEARANAGSQARFLGKGDYGGPRAWD